MEITLAKVQSIVNTLPIGYYLGADVPVVIENPSAGTRMDPINRIIYISYPMCVDVCNKLPESTDDIEIEKRLRSFLYHELSHVILTPRNMPPTDVINIFEDERIETILRDYYKLVDFKGFIKEINNWDGKFAPMDAMSAFYHIVRYRIGPVAFVERVKNLIVKHNKLNSMSPYACYFEYQTDIYDLYRDIEKWFDETPHMPSLEGKGTKSGATESDDEGLTESTASDSAPETDDSPDKGTSTESEGVKGKDDMKADDGESIGRSDTDKTISDELPMTKEELDDLRKMIKSVVKSMLSRYENIELQNKLKEILFRNSGRIKNGGAAIHTYSGVLQPRAVQRDDYKWWVKSNHNGSVNKFDRIKLNLFIDVSGSFCGSENKINEIIKALLELEKINPKFTFDVVTMGMDGHPSERKSNVLKPKLERTVRCTGGNALTDEIFDVYRQVQDQNKTVYNIVVFDGDALSFDFLTGKERLKYIELCKKNFGAFNHSNCTVISDYDNEACIRKYSPSSHNIFCRGGYADQLQDLVIETLDRFMR